MAKVEDVEHCFDHKGSHWIVATIDGKRVRGHPTAYSGIAELVELRAVTEYYGPERVYVESLVPAVSRTVVTPFEDNGREDWHELWANETQVALASVPLYED